MVQPEALAVYDWLREWADGSDLLALADRMESAPDSQVAPMLEQWPDRPKYKLDEIEPGTLRPLVTNFAGSRLMIESALALLLYCDSVVMSPNVAFPNNRDFALSRRNVLVSSIRSMAMVEPLVRSGSLLFFPDQHRYRFWDESVSMSETANPNEMIMKDIASMLLKSPRYAEFLDALESEEPGRSDWWPGSPAYREEWAHDLNRQVNLWWKARPDDDVSPLMALLKSQATPLALTPAQKIINDLAFGDSRVDGRRTQLQLLVQMTTPGFHLQVKELVRLRQNSDKLFKVRETLREALSTLGPITNERDFNTAKTAFSNELQRKMELVHKEAETSLLHVLAHSAGPSLAVGLLTSMTEGLAGRSSTDAAIDGAATAVGSFFFDVIREMQHRAESRQLLSVVTSLM